MDQQETPRYIWITHRHWISQIIYIKLKVRLKLFFTQNKLIMSERIGKQKNTLEVAQKLSTKTRFSTDEVIIIWQIIFRTFY